MLEHKEKKLTVFVVWEPVIGSDIGPPSEENQARISDTRAAQFWDEKLLLSAQFLALVKQSPERFSEWYRDELKRREIVWDSVAVFAPGVRWEGELPYPDYSGGPVVDVTKPLSDKLNAR